MSYSQGEIPLATARQYAARIIRAIRPYCHKVRIAGSVRRRCPVVHDIDIVVLPRDRDAIKARCERRSTLRLDSELHFQFDTPLGIRVEIYYARPEDRTLFGTLPSNWASLLVCRTGSTEHNVRMALAAKANGRHWDPYGGVTDSEGRALGHASERDIFKACGVPYKRPEDRI